MTTQVRNPFERGPFVQIGGFCERILREADGVLSLIRVVDVVTHSEHRPDAPEEMPTFHYPLTLVLALVLPPIIVPLPKLELLACRTAV